MSIYGSRLSDVLASATERENRRHLSHKTVDLIHEHDWIKAPTLMLYSGGIPIHEQIDSLLSYLGSEAKFRKIKFSIKVGKGFVKITRVG